MKIRLSTNSGFILLTMLSQVDLKSSILSFKSGTAKHRALLIFAASKVQLLIPTKLIPFLLPSNSKWLCKTFKGLYFDLSANPNSSNNIIDIGKSSFLLDLDSSSNLPSAILKIPFTSFGVVELEPWK